MNKEDKKRAIIGVVELVSVISAATIALLFLISALPDQSAMLADDIGQWAVLPLMGTIEVFRAVRKGLPGIVMSVMPTGIMLGLFWLMVGMMPTQIGAVLTGYLLSVIGASAGEVLNKRDANRDSVRNRRRRG